MTFDIRHSVLVANPQKLLYTVTSPACGLLNRGEKNCLAAPPSPPTLLVRGENITQSRDAGTCLSATVQGFLSLLYKDSFDSSARPMGVASQNSTLPCAMTTFQISLPLSSLLAMSSRVHLFFPPRGHEPPATLHDRTNTHLSL